MADQRDDEVFLSRAIDTTIRIGLLVAIVAFCFRILQPFLIPIAWAMIIAVAVYPAYDKLSGALGGRGRLAAGVGVSIGMLALLIPVVTLGGTLVEGTQAVTAGLEEERIHVPPPPERVRDWPLIGNDVYTSWASASENLPATLEKYQPQVVALGGWLLSLAAGAGLAFLQSLVAIVIAGVLLSQAQGAGVAAHAISRRLASGRGDEFLDRGIATIRSVAQGIVGVALIQSFLAGVGFVAVGVPGAGLWALIGLLLCVAQVGLILIAVPAIIYVWSSAEPWVAVVFTIWTIAVTLLDNVLKPILLGRGVDVPMLVIFLGAIGGFFAAGIIGLFVGGVVLVLGYTLFIEWLEGEQADPADQAA